VDGSVHTTRGRQNYLPGEDLAHGRSSVATYERVRHAAVYAARALCSMSKVRDWLGIVVDGKVQAHMTGETTLADCPQVPQRANGPDRFNREAERVWRSPPLLAHLADTSDMAKAATITCEDRLLKAGVAPAELMSEQTSTAHVSRTTKPPLAQHPSCERAWRTSS
jgi:hypothetical protein